MIMERGCISFGRELGGGGGQGELFHRFATLSLTGLPPVSSRMFKNSMKWIHTNCNEVIQQCLNTSLG